MKKLIGASILALFATSANAQMLEPMPTGCIEYEWLEDILAHGGVTVLEENEWHEPVVVLSRYDSEVYHIHPTEECALVYHENELIAPN